MNRILHSWPFNIKFLLLFFFFFFFFFFFVFFFGSTVARKIPVLPNPRFTNFILNDHSCKTSIYHISLLLFSG